MIAAAGGQTYAIPYPKQRAQPEQAMPQQPEQSPWQTPMGEDLAYVENLTSNYYNAYGTLKDFTTTMWKDYGVDVTKPDFSQAGGGDLHQAYLAMDAELRMTANDLSQQKKSTEERDKLQAQGKLVRGTYVDSATGKTISYDPTKELERQFGPEGQKISPYVSTELNDTTLKAIEKAQQTYYDTGDVEEANRSLQPIKEEYARLMEDDPYNKEYYQRQLKAIMKATKTTPAIAFRPPSGTPPTDYTTLYKEIVSNAQGAWQGGYTTGEREGQAVAIRAGNGMNYGKVQIVENGKKQEYEAIAENYVRYPDGKVYVEFTNKKIEPQRIDNLSADKVIIPLLQNNALGGKESLEYFLENYQKSPSGTVDVTQIIPSQTLSELKRTTEESAKSGQAQLDALRKLVIEKTKPSEGTFASGAVVEIGPYKFTKTVRLLGMGGTTWTLDKESYKTAKGTAAVPKELKIEYMSQEDIVKFLSDVGYYSEELQKTPTQAAASTYSGPGFEFLN